MAQAKGDDEVFSSSTEHYEGSLAELQEQVTKSGLVGSWVAKNWNAPKFETIIKGRTAHLTFNPITNHITFFGPKDFKMKVLNSASSDTTDTTTALTAKLDSLTVATVTLEDSTNTEDCHNNNHVDGEKTEKKKRVDYPPLKSIAVDNTMSSLGSWNLPDKIIDRLYLGSHAAQQNKEVLKKLGVTHILTAAAYLSLDYPKEFVYKQLHVYDAEHQNLHQYFEQSIEFIEEGLASGGVLVHCAAGISRSSTIVIAFLMHRFKVSLNEAYDFVRARRWVCPNDGFYTQLQAWEKKVLEGDERPFQQTDQIEDALK